MTVLETVQRRPPSQSASGGAPGARGSRAVATAVAPRGTMPRGMAPSSVLAMQRGAGNAAVSRVIQRSIFSDVGDAFGDAASAVGGAVSDAAGDVRDFAVDAAEGVRGFVSDAAGDVRDFAVDAAGDIRDFASDAADTIGGGLEDAWNWLSGGVSALVRGAQQLGQEFVDWVEQAASDVTDAISRFGAKAWAVIAAIGTAAFEQLVRGGQLFLNWFMNLPERLWRIAVHAGEGLLGVASWLSRAAGPALEAIQGVFNWVGGGFEGLLTWLGQSIASGAAWVDDFLAAPSFEKLIGGMLSGLSHLGDAVMGLGRWGLDGLAAAAKWVMGGLPALGQWLKDGALGGLAWAGEMALLLAEALGVGEALMLLWGIVFDLRPLSGGEAGASQEVHPGGLIPYDSVRVDEEGIIWQLANKFAGPGSRVGAVTSLHIISTGAGEMSGDLAVHELSHVGQYEMVGAMYMPQAIHAQGTKAGYDYKEGNEQWAEGRSFSDFNREQQAQLCQDFYLVKHGGHAEKGGTLEELQPLIDDMRAGGW